MTRITGCDILRFLQICSFLNSASSFLSGSSSAYPSGFGSLSFTSLPRTGLQCRNYHSLPCKHIGQIQHPCLRKTVYQKRGPTMQSVSSSADTKIARICSTEPPVPKESLPASVAYYYDIQTATHVYLVGCFHISAVSAEDVRIVIQKTKPE